ncbi:MAG: hypothetical protein IPJ69_00015 [Deltaproteobacteria bacterium]|nr:MAG: hypothetical protein IPJ69_00015 [Deltaproteobacteria bacterium]
MANDTHIGTSVVGVPDPLVTTQPLSPGSVKEDTVKLEPLEICVSKVKVPLEESVSFPDPLRERLKIHHF